MNDRIKPVIKKTVKMSFIFSASLLFVLFIIIYGVILKIIRDYYPGYLIAKLFPGPKIYFHIGNVWPLFNKNPGKLVLIFHDYWFFYYFRAYKRIFGSRLDDCKA